MSRSSEPAPSPPSERLRVGECTVELPLREIHAPGARRPRRITPKAMGVLQVLVAQGGRVVSRDALLAQVWPGTLPTNDVVTQAITQLRKAFGDDSGDPRYIETIAKNGYRLLAPVEWLEAEAGGNAEFLSAGTAPTEAAPAPVAAGQAPGAAQSVPTPRRGWRPLALASVVVIALVIAIVSWSLRHERPAARQGVVVIGSRTELPYRLITSVPGTESAPSLSPDAALVAYVAVPKGQRRSAILVQTTDPSPPRQLTRPGAEAEDSAPAWSPDGREIAFLRVTPDRECRVLVVPANGGTERNVGVCDPRGLPNFDWTPDGRGLVFGSRGVPGDGVGLRVLDLASGRWRPLEYGATALDEDFAPRYSPDGRWIVFVRNSPVGDFWRVPATGGNARRLTELHADIRGWDWTPDGRGIVFGRWSESESKLLRLDLDSGVIQDLGVLDGGEPSLAATKPALAFMQTRNYFGIYRFGLRGEGGKGERLFASSGRDRLPSIAPDARQLVFASDRSGEFGLWWSDLQQPDSLRLIDGIRPESWHRPEWSPDSRRVLVVGSDRDGRSGLHEVVPASGRVSGLPSPDRDVVQALYLPGTTTPERDRLLVLAGSEDGRLRLTLYDRSTQPWRSLGAIDGVAVARVDGTGQRVLFTRTGQPGLWQADLGLSPASIRVLDPQSPTVDRYRAWAVAGDGSIYFMERTPTCHSLLRRRGDPTPPRCIDRERRAGPHGFSIDTRAEAVYITVSQWDGGDIGFMTLPIAPEVVGPN
jgi:Tol biopolymer transport system component/DNA-binding winged helix-turn-helix (wHTH) protein